MFRPLGSWPNRWRANNITLFVSPFPEFSASNFRIACRRPRNDVTIRRQCEKARDNDSSAREFFIFVQYTDVDKKTSFSNHLHTMLSPIHPYTKKAKKTKTLPSLWCYVKVGQMQNARVQNGELPFSSDVHTRYMDTKNTGEIQHEVFRSFFFFFFFGREHFEPLCAVLDFLAVYVQRCIFWTACFGIFFLEVPFFIMGFYSVHNNKTSDWIHWPIKPCKKFANVYNASLVCKWRPSFAQASAFSAAAWKEVSFTMVPDQRSFDTSAAF